MKKTTHNLKGCRCPEGSDIRFCLGEEPKPTTTIELTNEEDIERVSAVFDAEDVEIILNLLSHEMRMNDFRNKNNRGSMSDYSIRILRLFKKLEYVQSYIYYRKNNDNRTN